MNVNTTSDDESNRVEYNASIDNHLPEYVNFTPYRKILVRCFVLEYYTTEAGVLVKPVVEVPVKTQNGMAIKEMVDSPYPFSRKAIVVSVPEGTSNFKPGDTVLLDKHVVMATKVNENAPFHLAKGFTMDTWPGLEVPTSMKDPHYGYMLVEPNTEILGKL